MLTTYTSPPPPTHGSASIPARGRSTGQGSQFTCPVYIAAYVTNKASYSVPLSVTAPVVIGTCMVLVGMVESVPVPPQVEILIFVSVTSSRTAVTVRKCGNVGNKVNTLPSSY